MREHCKKKSRYRMYRGARRRPGGVRQDAEHRKATPLGDGAKKGSPGGGLFFCVGQ